MENERDPGHHLRRTLPPGRRGHPGQAIEACSPYGQEAVICRLNGQMVRSIDDTEAHVLRDGDVLEIYPLIIGG